MKKQLFRSAIIAMALILTACSGGDDSPVQQQNVDTSQLLSKWKIYKAVYGAGTEPLLYDTNGCGKEILEFTNDGEVTETTYVDANCMFGGAGTYSWWVLNNGQVAFGAQNSYHHIVTVSGNELVLDAREEADYIKYYIRVN
jgi:hypothetical protein